MDFSDRKTTLSRFFSGLAENTFHGRLGVADPPLIDYISELLTRFVHCDAIYKVRDLAGRRLEEVAEMLVEADARIGNPQREVHRHIGDFALFWTGVYPESLKRPGRSMRDRFVDYCAEGKRSYYIASTLRTEENDTESDVLARLSYEFELCAFGLAEVRREWERRDDDGVSPGLLWIE